MRTIRNGLVLALGITMTALGATACGSGGDQTPPAAGPNEHVDLTLATFTEFGYEALIPEYERLHPNIKITHRKTGQGGPVPPGPHHQAGRRLRASPTSPRSRRATSPTSSTRARSSTT